MVTIVQTLVDTLALVLDVRMYVTVLGIYVTTKLGAVYLKVRLKKQIFKLIVM